MFYMWEKHAYMKFIFQIILEQIVGNIFQSLMFVLKSSKSQSLHVS